MATQHIRLSNRLKTTGSGEGKIQERLMNHMQSIMKMLSSSALRLHVSVFNRINEKADCSARSHHQLDDQERTLDSAIINDSRRKRIVLGADVQIGEVNSLLKQHTRISRMFKTVGSGGGKMQQRLMSQMQGMQKFGR